MRSHFNEQAKRTSRRLVMAGFVYAVYENEESVHQILHTCSTKTDRTLDDGRCEYYLDVYSPRMNARRKSVGVKHPARESQRSPRSRFKSFLGSWCVVFVHGERTKRIDRRALSFLGGFAMVSRK